MKFNRQAFLDAANRAFRDPAQRVQVEAFKNSWMEKAAEFADLDDDGQIHDAEWGRFFDYVDWNENAGGRLQADGELDAATVGELLKAPALAPLLSPLSENFQGGADALLGGARRPHLFQIGAPVEPGQQRVGDSLTRDDFVDLVGDGAISVEAARRDERLAGVSVGVLDTDQSGAIEGDEVAELFAAIDEFDRDTRRTSIAARDREGRFSRPGAAAAAALELAGVELEGDPVLERETFLGTLRGKAFGVAEAEQNPALAQIGVRRADRNGDGVIQGPEHRLLFGLLDRADRNGDEESIRMRTDEGATVPGPAAKAALSMARPDGQDHRSTFLGDMEGHTVELTPELRARPELAGVNLDRALGEGDQLDMDKLFTEVDRLDGNGDPDSIAPTDEEGGRTPAAIALNYIRGLAPGRDGPNPVDVPSDGATPVDVQADGATPVDVPSDGATPVDAQADGVTPADAQVNGATPVDPRSIEPAQRAMTNFLDTWTNEYDSTTPIGSFRVDAEDISEAHQELTDEMSKLSPEQFRLFFGSLPEGDLRRLAIASSTPPTSWYEDTWRPDPNGPTAYTTMMDKAAALGDPVLAATLFRTWRDHANRADRSWAPTMGQTFLAAQSDPGVVATLTKDLGGDLGSPEAIEGTDFVVAAGLARLSELEATPAGRASAEWVDEVIDHLAAVPGRDGNGLVRAIQGAARDPTVMSGVLQALSRADADTRKRADAVLAAIPVPSETAAETAAEGRPPVDRVALQRLRTAQQAAQERLGAGLREDIRAGRLDAAKATIRLFEETADQFEGLNRQEAFRGIRRVVRSSLAGTSASDKEALIQALAEDLPTGRAVVDGRDTIAYDFRGVVIAEATAELRGNDAAIRRVVTGLGQDKLNAVAASAAQLAGHRHDIAPEQADAESLVEMIKTVGGMDGHEDRGHTKAMMLIAATEGLNNYAATHLLAAWRVGREQPAIDVTSAVAELLGTETGLIIGSLRGEDPTGKYLSLLFAYSFGPEEHRRLMAGDDQPLTGENGRYHTAFRKLLEGDRPGRSHAEYFARGTAADNSPFLEPPGITARSARASLGYFVGSYQDGITILDKSFAQTRRVYTSVATTAIALAREGGARVVRRVPGLGEFISLVGRYEEGDEANGINQGYARIAARFTAAGEAIQRAAIPDREALRGAVDPRGFLFPENLAASQIPLLTALVDEFHAARRAPDYSDRFKLEPWFADAPYASLVELARAGGDIPPELLDGRWLEPFVDVAEFLEVE